MEGGQREEEIQREGEEYIAAGQWIKSRSERCMAGFTSHLFLFRFSKP
jgi:hypothetical protein